MGQAGGASDGHGLVSWKFCNRYGHGWDHSLNMASITVGTETAGGGVGSSVGNGIMTNGTSTEISAYCATCGKTGKCYKIDESKIYFGSRRY